MTWVGVAGFEPAASSSRTKRAAKLRYTPAARNLSGCRAGLRQSSGNTDPFAHGISHARTGLAGNARYQGQQARLRAAGEPDRGPRRRAESRRDVQPGPPVRGVPVQAADPLPFDAAVGH